MNNAVNEKFGPIRTGLLEFVLLTMIAAQSVYVADILKRLSETEFKTQEGTLYPLLSRMRREELLEYEWKESEVGPPRKYYRLTHKGKEQLAQTQEYWKNIISTIKKLG
jgi:PadR family transcriptional regulator PadR